MLIAGLKAYYGDSSSKIDFNLHVLLIEKSQFGLEVESDPNSKWNKLGIQFLASTREDIEFGEAIASSPTYNYQDVFQVEYELNKSPEETTSITPFLCGL